MITTRFLPAGLAALALAAQPLPAAAQQRCLTAEEVGASALYAVPALVRGARIACGATLAGDGFLMREGDALAARYAAHQDGAWPAAKAALLKIVAERAGTGGASPGGATTDMGTGGTGGTGAGAANPLAGLALLPALPDEHVRPLVDTLIAQETAARLPPAQCPAAERVLAALAPIEPPAAATLLAALVALMPADRAPLLCPADRS